MKITLKITIEEDGFYIGQLKEFPEVITEGKTEAELIENIKDALSLHFEYLRDKFTNKEVISKKN